MLVVAGAAPEMKALECGDDVVMWTDFLVRDKGHGVAHWQTKPYVQGKQVDNDKECSFLESELRFQKLVARSL